MKDSREKLIKRFLCLNTNTKFLTKENKVYFLLLHEDLYPILFQNAEITFVSKNYVANKTYSKDPKKTLKRYYRGGYLKVKYIISLLRSNKFAEIKRSFFSKTRSQEFAKDDKYLQLKKTIVFHFILESIAFILLCSQYKKNVSEQFFVRTKHISISTHKPLEFIEKQWQSYSFVFQGRFFCFFHPEILMRILRKKFQDISFLHLIRKFLHSNLYLLQNTGTDSSLKKIRNILWNIYVLEIDNFFVADCQIYGSSGKRPMVPIMNHSFSCLQKINEWTYFLQKEEYKRISKWKEQMLSCSTPPCSSRLISCEKELLTNRSYLKDELEKRRQISFLDHSSIYKYFRTNTNWFLFFQKQEPWNLLIKRRILLFFIRRLGYLPQKSIINSTIMSLRSQKEMSSYFFLAYILQFTKQKNVVKINTKLFFLTTYFVSHIVSFINPFYLIILILSKQNFCSTFGDPKSKSGWVTWSDSEIIQQYNRIRNSFFLFYSGCHNTKALSRIQYILYLSCAKTLASKHKTKLRHIYKKFGRNLRNKEFSTVPSAFLIKNQSKNSRLRFFYKNQNKTRMWNFHLTQMETIFFHLEDLYRKI